MNAIATPPVTRAPNRNPWLWLLLLLVSLPFVVIGALTVAVANCFYLSADTEDSQSELARAGGSEWRQQIAFSIGSVPLWAARTGLACVKMDAEARAAVQSVRGVEVGIYELASGSKAPDRAAMLTAADKAMTAHGWERVVGVLDGDEMVGVYLPTKMTSPRRVQACVVVLDGRQLVIVSARGNLEPLMECLRNNPKWRAEMRSLASR